MYLVRTQSGNEVKMYGKDLKKIIQVIKISFRIPARICNKYLLCVEHVLFNPYSHLMLYCLLKLTPRHYFVLSLLP